MQGNDQQAYDRGITIFSPDGRLYQVEYAREAVKRGSASVGVRTAEGIVLVADGRLRSSLQEPASVEKIHAVDDHLAVASAGHAADARQLVDLARRRAQGERLRYGEPIGVEALTKALTDHVQESTQTGGTRPYGAALLVAGVEDGEPRLFETDPSGTPYEWKAATIGANRDAVQDRLETGYDPELTLDDGLGLALDALDAVGDGDLDPTAMGAATISAEDPAVRTLSTAELESALGAS